MPIDARANSEELLTPPAPLPHISRRALKRVHNPLPAPSFCRYCGDNVGLVENSVIYRGRSYGEWPYAYLCFGCGAYVGIHPHTDIPLGTLADPALRQARNTSKAAFHKLKDVRGLSRSNAYAWLAREMKIEVDVCHFGWFEHQDCALALSICQEVVQ